MSLVCNVYPQYLSKIENFLTKTPKRKYFHGISAASIETELTFCKTNKVQQRIYSAFFMPVIPYYGAFAMMDWLGELRLAAPLFGGNVNSTQSVTPSIDMESGSFLSNKEAHNVY